MVYIGGRQLLRPGGHGLLRRPQLLRRTASARTWAREHPDVTGNIAGQSRAEEIARQTFGALLAGD